MMGDEELVEKSVSMAEEDIGEKGYADKLKLERCARTHLRCSSASWYCCWA